MKRLRLPEVGAWRNHFILMLVLKSRTVAVTCPTVLPELQKAYRNDFSRACQSQDEHDRLQIPGPSTRNCHPTPVVSRAANLHLRTIAAAIQTVSPFWHLETN